MGVERFTLSFKTVFNGHTHRHVVLGISHGGHYGALGMSRRTDLMYKPLEFKVGLEALSCRDCVCVIIVKSAITCSGSTSTNLCLCHVCVFIVKSAIMCSGSRSTNLCLCHVCVFIVKSAVIMFREYEYKSLPLSCLCVYCEICYHVFRDHKHQCWGLPAFLLTLGLIETHMSADCGLRTLRRSKIRVDFLAESTRQKS